MQNLSNYFIAALLLGSHAFAADEAPIAAPNESAQATTKAPAPEAASLPNKIEVKIETNRVEIQGVDADKNGLYSYRDITFQKEQLAAQYKFHPLVNATVKVPYLNKASTGDSVVGRIDDKTSGLGDVTVESQQILPLSAQNIFAFSEGVSLPTGGTDYKRKNSIYNQPYFMQLGSGTYDFNVMAAYIHKAGLVEFNAALASIIRTGEGDQGYRLGNIRVARAGAELNWTSQFKPNLTYTYRYTDAINGADETYGRNPIMEYYHAPQEDWDFAAGVTGQFAVFKKSQLLKNSQLKLGYEIAVPLAQQTRNVAELGLDKEFEATISAQAGF